MDKEIKIFENEQFGSLRIIDREDGPWFVGKDVCEMFGDKNPNRSISRVDDIDKKVISMKTNGGTQNITIINESGLYSLLFTMQPQKANKEGVSDAYPLETAERIAKLHKFKRWVTHDVLPSIRKHGMYATPEAVENFLNDPDSMIKALQALKEERAARIEAEKAKLVAEETNRLNAPKVLFADCVSQADTDILVGELAKLLKQNGMDIGQNRLYEKLRAEGFIMKNSTIPTQRAMEMGLFRVIERSIMQPNGTTRITQTTKVTGKGQQYFVNRYIGR